MQELQSQILALKDDVAVVRQGMNALLVEIEEIKEISALIKEALAPMVIANTAYRLEQEAKEQEQTRKPWWRRA